MFSLACLRGQDQLWSGKTRHDFIIADRRVVLAGLRRGVGDSAVLRPGRWARHDEIGDDVQNWGMSGLFWFVVPNGFAVMAMRFPFARYSAERETCLKVITISNPPSTGSTARRLRLADRDRHDDLRDILEILINLQGHVRRGFDRSSASNWKVATRRSASVCVAHLFPIRRGSGRDVRHER